MIVNSYDFISCKCYIIRNGDYRSHLLLPDSQMRIERIYLAYGGAFILRIKQDSFPKI